MCVVPALAAGGRPGASAPRWSGARAPQQTGRHPAPTKAVLRRALFIAAVNTCRIDPTLAATSTG
jgi:hypothetical protein